MIEAEFKLLQGEFQLSASFHDEGITLLTGENGAGKSTFLNALAGFIPLQSGIIRINGRDITEAEVQKRGIVHISPGSFIGNLSVDRHIAFPGKPDGNSERIRELKESFGIDFNGKVGNLSMGQKIRVSLATAFYKRPEAVLIDEAISNLSDPFVVMDEVRKLSISLKTDVILVAHSLPDIRADHSYSIANGIMQRAF